MTYGSVFCAVSSSLDDPAELGVNTILPLRENVEGVTRADLGEEVGVLSIRERLRRPRLSGGPEEMDWSRDETVNAGDDLLFQRGGVE